MKKTLYFISIIIILTFLYISYNYTIIRKGLSLYFMEKHPPTFEEVYIDATNWTIKDYVLHPKISTFLISEGIKEISTDMKIKIRESTKKYKKELKEIIENNNKNRK